ncbi:hypothetical protein HMPREF0653_00503 [Prevotella disiens JCM 6334 = ATCC 29426]|uniref:DUF6591 domain-containing protein n=3 Tax=Prevotella disiens TaxID=28130 RepID=A0A379DYY0_9BACT|nr:DUF6591 domain-containing protein [Prevotella disiens]ERJ80118.1 hypothetical protein HMPREF0653_00503 [Prevotella disiens JCM 6334 = ATCC 29426]SUB85539.1 Uncharacterised protein [Prevotella disiens]
MKKLIFSGFLALTSMGLVSLTSCNEKKNDSAVTDTMTNSVDTLLSDDTIDGSGNNESSVSESSESSSSNIDELIESYDKYVTDYIAFAKKAQKGDVSAMQDYAQMLENAQDLQEKLNAVEGEMTPEQLKRFNKIVSKLAKASSESIEAAGDAIDASGKMLDAVKNMQ